jgi:hypothetical protein
MQCETMVDEFAVVDIVAFPRKPFTSPEDNLSYYCKVCSQYTSDFAEAAIRTEYRRCRACQKALHDSRKAALTNVGVLKRKLNYNFLYHKRPQLAKALTEKHILQILKASGLTFEDEIDLVKTISPNFDPLLNQWTFQCVFKPQRSGRDRRAANSLPTI